MADVNQIYTIVNAAAKMVFGETAIQAVDSTTYVALGDKILQSNKDVDKFNSALSDVIGRTIISIRPYNGRYKGMIKKPFDYGSVLRKIYVEVGDAEKNVSWEIGSEGYTPTYPQVIKPTVKQHLFDKISTYEFGVSIPYDLWETAFHDEKEMAMLIDAIFMSMETKTQISLDNMSRLVRAAFIARTVSNGGVNAINLLAQYNTQFTETLTPEAAIYDKDFIRWSNMIIGMFTDRLEEPSRLFNNAKYLRHTPKEYQVLTVLSNYAKASSSYLQSDTYHQELVAMPYYDTVPFWQGTGTSYTFKDVSTVSVTLEKGADPVTVPYVLAILSDIEAMGITIDKPRTVAETANHYEFVNYWNKVNRGYYNDMSENAVVFYMAAGTAGVQEVALLDEVVKSAKTRSTIKK